MNKRFITYVGSLLFLLSTVFALAGLGSTAYAVVDDTPDCDDGVAIINCGTGKTTDEMRARYDKNATGDLPKIFGAFGISRADLNGTFQSGVVWRNGNVTIDGKVVATGAITAGRNFGGTPIAGTNAGKYPTSKFATEGQTAWVKMINGKFSFAVLKSCGNPISATPKIPQTPAFKCVSLKVTEVSRTKRTFTAEATATGGATIEKYEFGFGDGFGITVPTKSYTYDYKKTGTFKTNVVVHVKVNGVIKKVTSPACEKTITVTPPPTTPVYACTSLMARLITKETRTYGFDLKYTAEGGAALRDADFSFGDGGTQKAVTPAQLSTVQHSYAKEGKYTTTATLHFTVAGVVKDKSCQVTFDISPEACPLNPSLPKNSPDCQPCPIPGKENLPKGSPDCKETPEVLAATGPSDIALGGLGLSTLTAAGYYWRASRGRLLSKLLGQ